MFVPVVEKVAKLEKEIEQKKEQIKRMKSEERAAARKLEAKRKIELGGVIDMIDKINAGQYPALALDVSLLIGALTNDLIMRRITAQSDFLRGEGDKRTNERKARGKK